MYPRRLRCGGIGRVRVVCDERKALGAGGYTAKGQRRREILAFAGVERWDRSTGRERARSNREAHRFLLRRCNRNILLQCALLRHAQWQIVKAEGALARVASR